MSDDLDLRQGADDTPEPKKSRLYRWTREAIISGSLILVLWLALGWVRAPSFDGPAPDFTLATLDGQTVTLSSLEGKTVVVNFWATWCGPCRVEIPTFSRFAENNPDIPVLGVAVDGTPEKLREAAKAFGITYPVLIADAATKKAYGISTLPTTVVVRPDGTVGSAHAGLMIGPHLWFVTR